MNSPAQAGSQGSNLIESAKKYSPTEIQLALMRKDFSRFVGGAWSQIEPAPLVWTWGAEAVCEHLAWVTAGDIRFLMINIPPRQSKSLLASVCWPAFEWVLHPELQFLTGSYTLQLARRDAMKSRRLIESPWYRSNFGSSFSMTPDENMKSQYSNDKGGRRVTTSTDATATGEGGNRVLCLTPDTPILTERGYIHVQHIVDSEALVKVVSYNHETNVCELSEIEAYEKNPPGQVLRITCEGRSVSCTSDHPVYVSGKGYVRADAVCLGDGLLLNDASVLNMQRSDSPLPGSYGENSGGNLLLSSMSCCRSIRQRQQDVGRGYGKLGVRSMRQSVLLETSPSQEKKDLLEAMSSHPCTPRGRCACDPDFVRSMRDVTKAQRMPDQENKLLLRSLQKLVSFKESFWTRKREIRSRIRVGGVRENVCGCGKNCETARRELSAMRQDARRERQTLGCASFRRGQKKQRSDEFGSVVSRMSQQNSWQVIGDKPGVVRAVVSKIERSDYSGPTYNLRVAKNHNYFAAGVLLHNCDDPHNVREVESEQQRMGVHDFWDNTLASRLNQANVDSWMVIGQRTHEDDLFGHIMETEDMSDVVHLVLPNEFDSKRRCRIVNPVTKQVFLDPRTTDGALLNPERLNENSTAKLKKKMSKSKYALQYQQDPKAGGGQIMRREKWNKWIGEPPVCEYLFSIWDTALGDKQQNDYSARTDWGLFRHRPEKTNSRGERYVGPEEQAVILVGAWRGKVPFYELRRVAKDAYNDFAPDYTLIEKKVSGISLIQEFRRAGIRVTPVSLDHGSRVKIDIKARAELAAPMLEEGLVYYMDRKFADEVISECSRVPGGVHDDYATTVCMALMWLRRRRELGSWEDEDRESGEVRLFKRKKRPIYG